MLDSTDSEPRARPLSREQAQAWQLDVAKLNPTEKEIAVREAIARRNGLENG